MAATINTNIASINAQRNLALSGQSLNTTMQRLSSGLRVNSAKDDAAGLAIAERMNTQVKGLTVAARNANDGISLAQTAEGALGKVGDMLQRMRELAVQASNATNSASDRAALQAEVSQLAAEIDRVAKQTNFNGQKILDGSFAGAVFQVGANSGDNVTLGALADTRASKISLVNYAHNTVSFDVNDNPTPAIKDYAVEIPAGELKITIGSTPPQEVELELIKPATSSLERLGQVVTAINNKSVDTGVTAYMSRDETTGDYKIELMSAKTDAEGKPYGVTFTGFTEATTGIGKPTALNNIQAPDALDPFTVPSLTIATIADPTATNAVPTSPNAADITNFRDKYDDYKVLDDVGALLAELDAAIEDYGTPANANLTEAEANAWNKIAAKVTALQALGDLSTEISEYNATLPIDSASLLATANIPADPTPAQVSTGITTLQTSLGINLKDPGGFDLANYMEGTAWSTKEGFGQTEALAALEEAIGNAINNGLNITKSDQQVNQRGLDSIDVTTQEGAWVALKKIDSAIDQINASRATLGAMQTRFETAVNNIDIQVENLSAARGRIVDADFAVETANLSRTQILQQAGTAMVAQANQIPQNVLQLLQG